MQEYKSIFNEEVIEKSGKNDRKKSGIKKWNINDMGEGYIGGRQAAKDETIRRSTLTQIILGYINIMATTLKQ